MNNSQTAQQPQSTTPIYKNDVNGWFKTIGALRYENERSGHYFFSRKTMKFFQSKIHGGIRHGKYFITSEQPPHGNRTYTVREIRSTDGDIINNPLGESFFSVREASTALKNHIKSLNQNN